MRSVPKVPVTVVVLTLNEEANLPACLASVSPWAEALVVVDSGSTDRTVEIARTYGSHLLSHTFETHARQWRWAMDNLPGGSSLASADWILGLDADQRVSPELAEELCLLLAQPSTTSAGRTLPLEEVDGFYVKRRQVFRGHWIRHGGYYPKYLLKLFRRSKVRFDDNDLVDHHFYVAGKVGKLRHDLIEENRKEDDIAFWIEKHSRYASLLAREEFARQGGSAGLQGGVPPALFGTPDQRSLWLKGLWFRLPLYLRPFLYFVYRYFFRLGILDGKEGFVFHFLQAWWFRLLVDIHLDQLRKDSAMAGKPQSPA